MPNISPRLIEARFAEDLDSFANTEALRQLPVDVQGTLRRLMFNAYAAGYTRGPIDQGLPITIGKKDEQES